MKAMTTLLICLLIPSNYRASGQTLEAERKVIVRDAGHGEIDSATVSESGFREKDVVLEVVQYRIAWNKVD